MEWQWDQSFAFGSTLAEKPELAPDDGKSYLPQTGGTQHHTGRKGCKKGGWVKKLKPRGWEELDNTPYDISYLVKNLKIQMNPTQNFLSHAQSLALRAALKLLKYWEYKTNCKTASSQAPPPQPPLFHRSQKVWYWIFVLIPTFSCYTATKICINRSFRSGFQMHEFLSPNIRGSSLLLTSIAACAEDWPSEGGENIALGSEVGLK